MKILIFFLLNLNVFKYVISSSIFCEKDSCPTVIPIYVNKLSSNKIILPVDYGDLNLCESKPVKESFGEILMGERLRLSSYEIKFKEEKICSLLCKKEYGSDNVKPLIILKNAIKMNYHHNWVLNNVPISLCYFNPFGFKICIGSFPIGCYIGEDGKQSDACNLELESRYNKLNSIYVYNHVDFIIYYQEYEENFEIIYSELNPRSIYHMNENFLNCDQAAKPQRISETANNFTIFYSYSVYWKNTSINWESRWYHLTNNIPYHNEQKISIILYSILILILPIIFKVFVFKPSHHERYCRLVNEGNNQEGLGRMHFRNNVFQPPPHSMLLSVLLGNGVQLLIIFTTTLILGFFGFFSPDKRGALMAYIFLSHVFLSVVSGYISARVYKTMKGDFWKNNILLTAFLVPGIIYGVFLITNLLFWYQSSSAAMPFGTVITVFSLLIFVAIPFSFIGSFFGFKADVLIILSQTSVNEIQRNFTQGLVYVKIIIGIFFASALLFWSIFFEAHIILNSMWTHQVFDMFSYLLTTFIFNAIIMSETIVYVTYFQIYNENYQWWWSSFFTSGFSSSCLFAYCTYYFLYQTSLSGIFTTIIYFLFTGILSFLVFLVNGTIGFFAANLFVYKIYF